MIPPFQGMSLCYVTLRVSPKSPSYLAHVDVFRTLEYLSMSDERPFCGLHGCDVVTWLSLHSRRKHIYIRKTFKWTQKRYFSTSWKDMFICIPHGNTRRYVVLKTFKDVTYVYMSPLQRMKRTYIEIVRNFLCEHLYIFSRYRHPVHDILTSTFVTYQTVLFFF